MNAHIFREYDIRGLAGRDLTPAVVADIGRAFAALAAERGASSVAVGRDCRLSSPELAEALVQGLVAGGMSVVDVGMVPTPVLYFAASTLPTDAGIQLTGSHNPPEYNGLKMMLGGEPVYGDAIQRLRQMVQAGVSGAAAGAMSRGAGGGGSGARRTDGEASRRYVDWVAERAQMGPRRLRVVVDGGNGAGGPTAVALLERLGVEVVPLFCEPDGRFPNHHPDPTLPEALEPLRERVVAEGADVGIGLDGDADRIGVIDESGAILWGDKLLILLARALLAEVPGATVVAEVKCSQTLFDDVAAHGGHPLMWKVGHSLIKAKMKETGALLAGEMSGHVFYKHRYFGFDDALYTATRLIEILSRSEDRLSEHLEGVPETFVTPEIRVDVGDDALKFAVAEAVAQSYAAGPRAGVRELVTLDGVRVIFDDGWGLLRASNTQPVLVMRAEATTPARRDAIEAELRERIAAARARLQRA